jgi:hypothetical protein
MICRSIEFMKNGFHSHGSIEFACGKESGLWKSIETKYATELASAAPLKKLKIKFQIQREFLRRRKEGHRPSAGTLW